MKFRLLTSLMTLMALLSSCSQTDGGDTSVTVPDDSYTISFQMVTSASLPMSRADSQHDEVGSEYESFEDGIDMDNLAIFVFGRIVGGDNTEKLLYKTTDIATSDRLTVVGSPGSYVVNITLTQNEVDEVLGFKLSPNDSRNIAFRMLILANCVGSEQADRQTAWAEVTGDNFQAVIGTLTGWSYKMDNIYDASYTGTDAVGLYGGHGRTLPMYGTNVFEVTQEALYDCRVDRPVYLGDVDMLRSVSKVRVVDNMPKDAAGYPKIVSSDFVSSQSVIRQLPYNAATYVNGEQVHTPNLYSDAPLSTIGASVYRLGTIPDSWTTVPAADRKGAVRIAFVPEQKIGTADGNIATSMPLLHVSVAVYKDHEGNDVVKSYEVPLKPYNDDAHLSPCTNIFRNHIYTVSIYKIETSLDFIVDVTPYTGIILKPSFGF